MICILFYSNILIHSEHLLVVRVYLSELDLSHNLISHTNVPYRILHNKVSNIGHIDDLSFDLFLKGITLLGMQLFCFSSLAYELVR